MPVLLNKKVKNHTLSASGDNTISLEDYRGRYLVLFFYPRDNTPGCTQESIDFTNQYDEFQKLNADILGVSCDTVNSHNKFKKKYNMPFELLSDSSEMLCNYFSVLKEKNMYGKKFIGIERSTFLISPDGTLIQEWRKVKVPNHVQEVLDAVISNINPV